MAPPKIFLFFKRGSYLQVDSLSSDLFLSFLSTLARKSYADNASGVVNLFNFPSFEIGSNIFSDFTT